MTRPEPVDLLELAEDVAAGRMTAADAELSLGSAQDDQAAVRELRQLVAAATAIRLHAAAFHESVEVSDPTTAAARDGAARPLALATPTVRRGSTIARRSTGRRSGLLIAATLAVAGGTIGAVIVGSSPSPSPRPSQLADISAEPSVAPGVIPDPYGVKPRVVVWLSGPERIEVSLWGRRKAPSATPFEPAFGEGFEIDMLPMQSHPLRDVLAAPSGGLLAIYETDGEHAARSRLRVADHSGVVLWSRMGSNAYSWAPEGTRLAVATDGGRTWTVVTFAEGSQPGERLYKLPPADRIDLGGFSADGDRLLGWVDGSRIGSRAAGFDLDLASGVVERFDQFPKGRDGLAISNRARFGRMFDPWSARWVVPDAWQLYTDGARQDLTLPVHEGWEWTDAVWAGDGSLLFIESSLDTGPPSNGQLDPVVWRMRQPAPGANLESLGPVGWPYSGPFGSRSRAAFLGAGGDYYVTGASVLEVPAVAQPGWDEIGIKTMTVGPEGWMFSGGSKGPGAFDLHFGGLVRWPD
jgi:hypothetical protein